MGPLFTQARPIKCFKQNRPELGAVGHCPFRLLILGMDHPEGLSFHRHPRELPREAWESLGARQRARATLGGAGRWKGKLSTPFPLPGSSEGRLITERKKNIGFCLQLPSRSLHWHPEDIAQEHAISA